MAVDPRVARLARRIAELEDKIKAVATTPSLAYRTISGGAITATDAYDNQTMVIGQQHDGTSASTVVAGPPPPAPTVPLVTAHISSLTIYWDGTFADGSVAPMDFSRVTVHAIPSATFTTLDPTDQTYIVGTFDHATGGEITAALQLEEYVVLLVAWSQAGKFSSPSSAATGTPLDVSLDPATLQDISTALQQSSEALDEANAAAVITVSDTAPASPSVGDLWYDTSLTPAAAKVWNGSGWNAADSAAQGAAQQAADAAQAASSLAGTKAKVTVSGTAPASPAQGDVWYDTATTPPQALMRSGSSWVSIDSAALAAASAADSKAADALSAAAAKATVTVATVAPSGPAVGDIWYDTSTATPAAKVWNGTTWKAADAAAQAAASAASTLAGLKAKVTVGTSIPTSAAVGDFWYDTALTPTVTYVCKTAYASGGTVGANWLQVADPVAQGLANAKSTTTVSSTAPTTPRNGDAWVDTALTPNATFVWNSATSTWVATDATAQAIAQAKAHSTTGTSAPSGPANGDLWYDTSAAPAQAKVWNGSSWVAVDSGAAASASQAYALAGQKAKVTVATSAPSSPAQGDFWVDTSTTPTATKTWTGSAWVATDAVSQSIANGKSTVYTSSSVPAAAKVNDLWNDSSVTPRVTRVCTTAYSSGGTVAANWGGTVSDAVAQTIANAKAKITVGTSAPSSPAAGDSWVNTSTAPPTIETWNGSSWAIAGDPTARSSASNAQTTADSANTAAGNAQTTANTAINNAASALNAANAKATVVVSSTQPSTHAVGDVWYDTSTTPAAAKVWNGSAYVAADSAAQSAAASASSAASAASALAGTKADFTIATTAPTTKQTGDVWYDTSTTPAAAKTWNGSTWVAVDSAAISAADSANTAAGNAQTTANTAVNNAASALSAANAKATVVVSSTQPSTHAVGDVWYDTSTTPAAAKVWNGSAYVAADSAAQSAASAASAAASAANTLAGTKAKVTVSSTIPSSAAVGDIWYDTAVTPNVSYTCSTAYASGGSIASNYKQTDAAAVAAANSANTAAGNAQTTANSAITQNSFVKNPMFSSWSGTWPDNWASDTHGVPIKETTLVRTGPYGLRLSLAAGATTYCRCGPDPSIPVGTEYVVITTDVYLVSGDFSGAGILLRGVTSTGVDSGDLLLKFADAAPSPNTGQWYRFTKTIDVTAARTYGYHLWTMAGYGPLGTITAKDIVFDSVNIRPATDVEIQAYNSASSSALATVQTLAASKAKVTVATSAPSGPATGDIWYDTSSTPAAAKTWNGSSWAAADAAALSAAQDALSAAQGAQGAADGAQNDANTALMRIDSLSVGDLAAGTLNVDMEVAGAIIINQGDSTKNTILIDPNNGIQIIDPDGNTNVSFPTDPANASHFAGQVDAFGLTTYGPTHLTGAQNELSSGATMVLKSAVSPPGNTPVVSSAASKNTTVPGYTPQYLSDATLMTGGNMGPRDTAPHFGALFVAYRSSNGSLAYRATAYSPNILTTAVDVSGNIPANVVSVMTSSNFAFYYSMSGQFLMIGNTCFMLYMGNLYKWTHGSTASAVVFTMNGWVTIGTDGTNLYAVTNDFTSTTVTLYSVNQSTGAQTSIGVIPGSPTSPGSPAGDWYAAASNSGGGADAKFYKGTFDRGSSHFILEANGATWFLDPASLASVTPSPSGPIPGRFWDPAGARFYDYTSGTIAKAYSKNADLTPIWVAYTWRNPGSGDHETTLSPASKFTPTRYAGISVQRPVPPTAGLTGDVPQTARIYAARGTTQPSASSFRMFSEDNDTAASMISLDMALATTAPPAANEFSAGTPAIFQSDAGGFVVKGDGSGSWPALMNPITDDIASLDTRVTNVESGVGSVAGVFAVQGPWSSSGPTHSFTLPRAGKYRFEIWVSAFATSVGQTPSVLVGLDGTSLPSGSVFASPKACANVASSHFALQPGFVITTLNAGAHTMQLTVLSGNSDSNDWGMVTWELIQ